MSIQSTINQGMSVAALLFSQSDTAKNLRSIRMAKKDIATYETMADEGRTIEGEVEERMANFTNPSNELRKEAAENVAAAQTTIAEMGERGYKELFRLKPSAETYNAYQRHAGEPGNIQREKERYISKLDKQKAEEIKANDAVAAEMERIAATPSFDLSKLAEGPRARVERAYQRAERDTYYLNKNKKEDTK